MHYARTHLNGNPYLGIFAAASETHLFVSPRVPRKVIREISEALEVSPVRTTVAGTELVGTFLVANSSGVLVPQDATSSEVETLESGTGLDVKILRTRFNALGNLVLGNDRGAVAGGVYSEEALGTISDALGVSTETGSIDGLSIVGSLGRVSNHGGLVSPKAREEEIRVISRAMDIKVERGTANFGVGNIGTCILANTKGVVAGMPTSGIEMGKIQQVFEEGAW
jgi:translation initiation factor 6